MRYCYYCMNEVSIGNYACQRCGNRLQMPPTPPRFLQPGTVIDNALKAKRYLIGKNIGSGGFGNAYIALDLDSKRRCCIKEYFLDKFCSRSSEDQRIVIPYDPEGNDTYGHYFRSFLTECERLRDLQNTPHVVDYYDHFTCNGTAYLVMEFLEGCTLRSYAKERPGGVMSPLECVDTMLAVLEALSGVHNKKIIHRDLSPDNVFVMPDRSFKLIDFGAAKDENIDRESRFVKAGYTAPEVESNEAESFYTDLYSIGAIMYFLMTGKAPMLHGSDPSSEILANMHAPRELEDVFQKAVRRKPRDRYQSAEDMAIALQKAREKINPVSVPRTGPTTTAKQQNGGVNARALLISMLVVLVMALTAVILWAALSDDDTDDPAITARPPAEVTTKKPAATTRSAESATTEPATATTIPIVIAPVPSTAAPVSAPPAHSTDRESEAAEDPSLQPSTSSTSSSAITPIPMVHLSTDEHVGKGSGAGFQSLVVAHVALNEQLDTITDVALDTSRETAQFGMPVMENEAFLRQFIGLRLPFSPDGLDTVAGATYTSRAAIEAVRQAAANASASVSTKYGVCEGEKVAIMATVSADSNGVITDVVLNTFGEPTGPAADLMYNHAYLNQFIGQSVPVHAAAVEGAEATCQAVITAINDALNQMGFHTPLPVPTDSPAPTPTDSPTPTPTPATPTPTPTDSPTPTPTPATPTPTPTDSPTPTPVPQLTTSFASRYILTVGTPHEIPLSFTHDSLEMEVVSSSNSVVLATVENSMLRLSPAAPGSADITLRHPALEDATLTVQVVEAPHYSMLSKAHEDVTLMGSELILPAGIEQTVAVMAELPLQAAQYKLHVDAPAGMNVRISEDGDLGFTLSAASGEKQHIQVWLEHPTDASMPRIYLNDLIVTGMPHVLTGDVAAHHTLYAGETLTLDFATSDNLALDWSDRSRELTGDVKMGSASYDTLRFEKANGGHGLLLTAQQSGEVLFTVCGEQISITVLALPTLSTKDGTPLSHINHVYTLTMPENATQQLQIGNVHEDLDLALAIDRAQQSEVFLAKNDKILTISSLSSASGTDEYRITHGGTLITVKVNVVKDGPVNDFDASYSLAQDGSLKLPVAFAHSMATTITPESSNASVATAVLSGSTLTVQGQGAGSATITLGSKQFTVYVYPKSIALSRDGQELNRRDGAYLLSIGDQETVTVDLPAYIGDLAEPPEVVFTGSGAHPDVTLNGTKLIVSGNGCGAGEHDFVLRLKKSGDVCTLRVATAFTPALNGLDRTDLTLYPGQTAQVGMIFRDGQAYHITPQITGDAASVTQDGSALTVTAKESGSSAMTFGEHTLNVQVLDLVTLTGSGLTKLPGDDNAYALTAAEGTPITLTRTDRSGPAARAIITSGTPVDMPSNQEYTFIMPDEGTHMLSLTGEVNGESVTLCTVTLTSIRLQEVEHLSADHLTLYPGQTATVDIGFARGNVFDVHPQVSGNADVTARQQGSQLVITANGSGGAAVNVGGKTLDVTVLKPVTLSGSALTGSSGSYSLTVVEHMPASISRTDGNGMYTPAYLRRDCGSNREQLTSLNGFDTLELPYLSPGRHQIDLEITMNGETVTAATINITVKPSELVTTFSGSYTGLLPKHDYTIPTSYTGNPVSLDVIAPDGLTVAQSFYQDALILRADRPGSYRVTVEDQTFTVQVDSLDADVRFNGQTLTGSDSGNGMTYRAPSVGVGASVTVEADLVSKLDVHHGETGKLHCSSFRVNDQRVTAVLDTQGSGSASFTLYAAVPVPAGMSCQQAMLTIGTITFDIEQVWTVSRDNIAPMDEDPLDVMTQIIKVLIDQKLVRGNAAKHAANVLAGDAKVISNVFDAISQLKGSHSGFSSGEALTRNDYELLLTMAKADVTPAPTATPAPRKESFTITDAALANRTLYLMDVDGYLIQYDIDSRRVVSVDPWARGAGCRLAGNGKTVLWISSANMITGYEGAAKSITEMMHRENASGVMEVAIANSSAIALLGADSYYTYRENDAEKNSENGGRAFYGVTTATDTTIVKSRLDQIMANIKLIAAGENTLAAATHSKNEGWKLYVSSTNPDADLRSALNDSKPNISKNALFTLVSNKLDPVTTLSPADIAVSDDCLLVVQTNGQVYILSNNTSYYRDVQNHTFTQLRGANGAMTGIVQAEVMDNHLLMLSKDGVLLRCGKIGGSYTSPEEIPGGWNHGITQLIALSSKYALAINGSGEILLLQDGEPQMNAFERVRD